MTPIEDASDAEDVGAGDAFHAGPEVNVGGFERGASLTMGVALLALALSQRRARGAFTLGLLGAYLSWRGATGHCSLYEALDTGSAEDEEEGRLAAGAHDDVSIEAAATIAQPPDEVYAFFRRLENAPRFIAFMEAVRFRSAPGGRGTEVRLDVEYDPPGSALGRTVARLLGSATEYRVEEDLRRLKQLLEAGETATTRGQPRGPPA